jgi:glutamyl-Q tRNA(Asp) synthetase
MQDDSEKIVTRFAPSPTGDLHLGHLYAALFASGLAAEKNGRFLLRYEDIDITRVRDQYYTQIEDDLRWAGLTWELPVLKQKTRTKNYENAIEILKKNGVVYPCFCTRKDIQRELSNLTSAPHGPEGPLYPGTCKHLTKEETSAKIAQGIEPSWRLNCEAAYYLTGSLHFTDTFYGKQIVNHHLLGDIVLVRKDIGTSYHIAVVIDDAFQGITDVSRGHDLLESTHVHRILQALLGLPEPRYHHHKLVRNAAGKRLAKRDSAQAIQHFRANNYSINQLKSLIQRNCF